MSDASRSIARLIDANTNRAAEGLRVLEDLARFRLDDASLSEKAKRLRHAVREACPSSATGSRDARGDTGREITTDTERERASVRAVAAAAAKRAQEALRVLEECAKLDGRDAAAIERGRYEIYELESALLERLPARTKQWRLCVLVTERLCAGDWQLVVRAAIAGGADCVQLREKELPDRELLARARRLKAICAEMDADAIINDRVDVALLAGAFGVHLGQSDLHIAEARRLAGAELSIGVSTSCMRDALAATAAGADVCGLGPVFASTTKDKPALAGPGYVAAYLADDRTAGIPHLAISGIDAARARDLAGIGCRGVAVSSAVCGAADPEHASRSIAAALA